MRTYANKSPKEKGTMQTMYFNKEQIQEILSISGPTGVLVMQHYVAIAHQTNPNMEDKVIANMLNMTERGIKRVRLELTNAGWFSRIKTTHNHETYIMYAVGKEAVRNHQNGFTATIVK